MPQTNDLGNMVIALCLKHFYDGADWHQHQPINFNFSLISILHFPRTQSFEIELNEAQLK